MRLRLKNFVIASSLLAFGFAVSDTLAKADSLTIFLSGPGGASVMCADGAACDTNPLAGVVTVTGIFGTATVAVTDTGSGTPLLAPLNLDLSYNLSANSSNPGGTFVVEVGERNLTATGVSFGAIANGNQGAGDTTAFSAFFDSGNTLFGNTGSLCSAGPVSTTIVNLACSGGPVTAANFSLTEAVTLTTPAGSTNASGDALLTPVPDASGFSILTAGGLFLLGAFKRKFNS
jgi:hypothetical protein